MTKTFNTDITCPSCGFDHLKCETPEIIKSNTIENTYICPVCGFAHNALCDEDMKEWIEHPDKPIEEEILRKQVRDFMGIVKETTDYHAKRDYGKAKLSLVPRRIIWDVAAIREYGNNKYPDGGPDNWRGVEPERYRDAAYRHFLGYLDDPRSVDSESGFPHLWHLACNIAFLCEMEDMYLSKNPEVVERLKKEFRGYQPPSEECSEDERSR